ncbi:putative methyl-CpG DNA binding, DNA-binding domain superfamily [Helianthus anomalus]|nr:putative methyl-CpG DNA binding, DNA-binding domain superfamily [Helianthus annuus]
MSNPEPLPADADHPTPTITPSEPEDPPATPDPLLGSGSFIDPTNGAHQSASKEPQSASKEPTNPDDLLQKYPRPSWLPDDWQMTLKKRTSGATEGTVDRYYIAPSGHRLRSKNEVLTFLETGSKRKKPSTPTPTASSDDASAKGSTPTPQTKKKKTTARKKVHAAFTFDFKNPPEKVSWCLSYATDDVWSPSIGDWTIPVATKQEWAAVFNHVSQS